MNILLIGLGGVTRTFRNWPERIIAQGLAERGHTVRAIGTHDPSRPALAERNEIIEGIQVQRVRSGYWPNLELHKALNTGPKPDVIHFMHPRNVLAQQASVWAAKRGIATVYTWLGPYHDAYLTSDRERPFDTPRTYERLIWTRRQLLQRCLTTLNPRSWRDHLRNYRLHAPLRAATHLLPCSQFEAEEMRRMGMNQPQTVVPLWIDTANLHHATHLPNLDASRPWLLFVGQLTPRKGYDLALQAMPMIIERYPNASLLIVSGINHAERAKVDQLTRELGINQHVHFLGRVEDAELVGLFQECDVYLTPTRYEGFGLTLLEAMAAGATLVASNIPVVNEIVRDGENGLLADYDKPESIARAAIRLLDDADLRQTIKANGPRSVQMWYNPQDLVPTLERAYEQAIHDQQHR